VEVGISVKDETLNRVIAVQLIEWIERGRHNEVIQAGIPPQMVDRLRAMSMPNLLMFGRQLKGAFEVKINVPQFVAAFAQVDRIMHEDDLFAYFASHGATAPMLREVFKADESRISWARRSLPEGKRIAGRPKLPDEGIQEQIFLAWVKHQAVPLRERYMKLHEEFPQFELGVFHAVLGDRLDRRKRSIR
jgi:Protein of unknown function (DUF2857)